MSTPTSNQKPWWKRIKISRFFLISLLVHLLIGLVATVLVVQTISARKLTFKGGAPTSNPNKKEVEHQVQMAKKKQTMSAPSQPRRVTTTNSLAKVSLPDMPALPALGPAIPTKMAGMGGTGMGATGGGGGGMGGGNGGGFIPSFGFSTQPKIGTLKGKLVDLKQFKDRKQTNMKVPEFEKKIMEYAKDGMNDADLEKYYTSPRPLFVTQFYIPQVNSDKGPEAFNLRGVVKPDLWIVHYIGKVCPTKTGTYYFIGEGDDFMYVKFDGKIVVDSCYKTIRQFLQPTAVYEYGAASFPHPFKKGLAIQVVAGKTYDMEVVIGDEGGKTGACLLIAEDGVEYQKDARGNPILPLFRSAPSKLPHLATGVPVMETGPIWPAIVDKPVSVLDAMKQKTP